MEGVLPPPYPPPQPVDRSACPGGPSMNLMLTKRRLVPAVTFALGFAAALALVMLVPGSGVGQGHVEERKLLDNERVTIVELVFPPGFKGDEHEAPVDEFAYVLDGEFAVW